MTIRLEPGLDFGQLDLAIESDTGRLLFAVAPLAVFCRANDLSAEAVLADEDTSCWLIGEWYCSHRLAGGGVDPVMEALLAAIAEQQESGVAALQLGRGHAH